MEELNIVSFHEYINEYRKQLEKGDIKEAYKGLMEYFNVLRLHFKKKYPDYFVSGSIYYGFMDMTYFSFFPKSLKRRKLKVAIVFLHEAFRFEVWFADIIKMFKQNTGNCLQKAIGINTTLHQLQEALILL